MAMSSMRCLGSCTSASSREQASAVLVQRYPPPLSIAWPRKPLLVPSFCFNFMRQRLQSAKSAAIRREQPSAASDHPFSDSLFIELIKYILRDLYNGFLFLLEQPKELKYLEFPSLQSAAKMALFTVAVVMVLIIFLATVDSAFSYIMASMFRRIK